MFKAALAALVVIIAQPALGQQATSSTPTVGQRQLTQLRRHSFSSGQQASGSPAIINSEQRTINNKDSLR